MRDFGVEVRGLITSEEGSVAFMQHLGLLAASVLTVTFTMSYFYANRYATGSTMARVLNTIACFCGALGQGNIGRTGDLQVENGIKTEQIKHTGFQTNQLQVIGMNRTEALTWHRFLAFPGTQQVFQPARGVTVRVTGNGRLQLTKSGLVAIYDPSNNTWQLLTRNRWMDITSSTVQQLGLIDPGTRSWSQLGRLPISIPAELDSLFPQAGMGS
jgi:hypothetical protein